MPNMQQIGKRNSRAGKKFERDVAKIFADYLGVGWKEFADRAGKGHKQSHDGIVLDKYVDLFPYWWECKYRANWDFNQFFKHAASSKPVAWFLEAEQNTASRLSGLLVFSKPHSPVYVMQRETNVFLSFPILIFKVNGSLFSIQEIHDFLSNCVAKNVDLS